MSYKNNKLFFLKGDIKLGNIGALVALCSWD